MYLTASLTLTIAVVVQVCIPVVSVQLVKKHKTAGLVPNGLAITMDTGQKVQTLPVGLFVFPASSVLPAFRVCLTACLSVCSTYLCHCCPEKVSTMSCGGSALTCRLAAEPMCLREEVLGWVLPAYDDTLCPTVCRWTERVLVWSSTWMSLAAHCQW